MALTVVQINFKLTMSGKEYEQAIAPLAQVVADVAGLQWKIWLLNEYSHEAGGIYLFEDEDAANAFLNGPLVAQVKSAPSIADLCVAQFAVLSTLTAITRGPVTRRPPGAGQHDQSGERHRDGLSDGVSC
jgi:hypothetical protein